MITSKMMNHIDVLDTLSLLAVLAQHKSLPCYHMQLLIVVLLLLKLQQIVEDALEL
jgi:hypothetical protein